MIRERTAVRTTVNRGLRRGTMHLKKIQDECVPHSAGYTLERTENEILYNTNVSVTTRLKLSNAAEERARSAGLWVDGFHLPCKTTVDR